MRRDQLLDETCSTGQRQCVWMPSASLAASWPLTGGCTKEGSPTATGCSSRVGTNGLTEEQSVASHCRRRRVGDCASWAFGANGGLVVPVVVGHAGACLDEHWVCCDNCTDAGVDCAACCRHRPVGVGGADLAAGGGWGVCAREVVCTAAASSTCGAASGVGGGHGWAAKAQAAGHCPVVSLGTGAPGGGSVSSAEGSTCTIGRARHAACG